MAKKNGKLLISLAGLAVVILGVVMSLAKTYYTLPVEYKAADTTLELEYKAADTALKVEIESCSDDIEDMHSENSADHALFESKDMALDRKYQEMRLDTVEMKSDLKYLRTDMLEQKTLSREILAELKEINK